MAEAKPRRRKPMGADDPRHGTTNGYGNLGCRCDACKEANRVGHAKYMAQARAHRRELGEHGSSLRYDTGCRCDECREAHNAKSREYKRSRRAQKSRE